MPRLLDYLSPLYSWLAAINPDLPRALFVALVFFSVWLLRKLAPNQWEGFANLIGVKSDDTSWLFNELRAAWQMLPAAIIGTIYGVLGTGADVWPTLKLTLLALLAPVAHRVAKRYQGKLGESKAKPPGSGSNSRDSEPTHIVFPQDKDGRPLELSASWLALLAGALMLLGACTREQAIQQINDPCSKVSLATIVAGCSARAKAGECTPGDTSCPLYLECKRAVAEWRKCPARGAQ